MTKDFQPGISIVIPERANPAYLSRCLESASMACSRIDEPAEIIVVVNGCQQAEYWPLRERFPAVIWRFSPRPLWFLGAVQSGVRASRYDWVYLLNNDMVLDCAALCHLLPWRSEKLFGIGSQIFFEDQSKRREETNWSSYTTSNGTFSISDDLPEDDTTVRGSLYCGGGSSLFRTALLKPLLKTTEIYKPFYWEDVEWGWRAWQAGYECLFCPASKVIHGHRQTNRIFFSEAEIDRIMERNRHMFCLRNSPIPLTESECRALISGLDARSQMEILQPWRWASIQLSRRRNRAFEPGPVWRKRYMASLSQSFPEKALAFPRNTGYCETISAD